MPYFDLIDIVWHGEKRWHLSEPETSDGTGDFTWAFTRCQPFGETVPLRARLRKYGRVVDFTLAGFDIPIISPRAMKVLAPHLAEFCEFIPIEVESQPSGYAILNVLSAEDCVHEQASELKIWAMGDGRADKVDYYRQITKLVLKSHLELPPIFRLSKFNIRVLVNEPIARLFQQHKLSGIVPERVSEEA